MYDCRGHQLWHVLELWLSILVWSCIFHPEHFGTTFSCPAFSVGLTPLWSSFFRSSIFLQPSPLTSPPFPGVLTRWPALSASAGRVPPFSVLQLHASAIDLVSDPLTQPPTSSRGAEPSRRARFLLCRTRCLEQSSAPPSPNQWHQSF